MENKRERQQAIPEEEAETKKPKKQIILKEFWWPSIQDEYSVVRQLSIEANNFELKPALINTVR